MFFEGSLQEGISTALQQSKQVVCFVTDDGSESRQWENEFLKDDSIRPGLESRSVILRLTAGSEEAGYLEALFPVPKKPTVVIIQNGQLKEYIAAGTSKEEFIRRIGKTNLPIITQTRPPTTTSTVPAANPSQAHQTSASSHNDDSLYDDVQPTTTTAAPVSSSTQSTTTTEEKRLTAAEKQKGKARAEAEEEAKRRVDERCGCDPPTSAEQAHANEVKLRKQQANEERKRILKRIEDDKRARKERDAAERRARSLLSADAAEDSGSAADPAIPLRHRLPKAGQGDSCNLQVRLMDGSTIRSRFASDKTLGTDVRQWIDTERTDGDAPYSFRVVLTPQPNKVIEPQEEIKSLLSLGLAPSATLVLIPTRYSVAYAGRRGGGIFSPVIGVFSSLFGAIMASIGGFFALFFGGGGNSGHEDIPMENLRARRRRDNQLYNGNSLNFEPRGEEDDEDTR